MRTNLFPILSLVLAFSLFPALFAAFGPVSHDQHIIHGGDNPSVFTRTLYFGNLEHRVSALVAAMNTKAPTIVTRGGAPYPEGAPGFSLDNFADIGAVEQYLYPEGPVIGFGHDNEGYITVGLWNGPPAPERAMTVDEIYTILEDRARTMGGEDIPVRFRLYTAPPTLILDAH
jgi:hypothetical protein